MAKKLKGTIISDKMDKTVVVKVSTLKKHPIYQRRFRTSKKYKAHDAENKYKTGEEILIEETKPISREKRWIVVGAVQKEKEMARSMDKEN